MTSTRSPAAGEALADSLTSCALPVSGTSAEVARRGWEAVLGVARDAQVVGVGGTSREAHQLIGHQQALLRMLVEELGFRSLALEEDWTLCLLLDRHVRTGSGDPRKLLHRARSFWATREMLATLEWIRARNRRHPWDPVRIAGLNADATDSLAYDAVEAYVERHAPARLPAVTSLLGALRPVAGPREHALTYRRQPDKGATMARAAKAYALLTELPDGPEKALALRHARAIVDFYEYHARQPVEILRYSTPRLAENLAWWHRHTGHKIVYWGGVAHTANGAARSLASPCTTGKNVGSWLRDWFGSRYVSVGLTFAHGHGPCGVPNPSEQFAEAILSTVPAPAFVVNLTSADHPAPVRAWLAQAAKLRLVTADYHPERDAAYSMSGGSLVEWFDCLIHTQLVTPAQYLVPRSARWPWCDTGAAARRCHNRRDLPGPPARPA